jgi:recombinational DNA repair protein RecR
MPCCGKPNNRAKKGAAEYYARYAYLSSHQRAKQLEIAGSKCKTCDALTAGDPCSICGNSKQSEQKEETG